MNDLEKKEQIILISRYAEAAKDNRWNLFWDTYYKCQPMNWGIGPQATLNFSYPGGRSYSSLKKSLETFNTFISLLGSDKKY